MKPLEEETTDTGKPLGEPVLFETEQPTDLGKPLGEPVLFKTEETDTGKPLGEPVLFSKKYEAKPEQPTDSVVKTEEFYKKKALEQGMSPTIIPLVEQKITEEKKKFQESERFFRPREFARTPVTPLEDITLPSDAIATIYRKFNPDAKTFITEGKEGKTIYDLSEKSGVLENLKNPFEYKPDPNLPETGVAQQFIKGYLGPYADVTGGLLALATGDEGYIEIAKGDYEYPWKTLTGPQKVAWLTGNIVSFGKMAKASSTAVEVGSKVVGKYLPKLAQTAEKVLAKTPALVKEFTELGAGGFTYGYVTSGGKPEEAAGSMLAFMGGAAIFKSGGKVLGGVANEVRRATLGNKMADLLWSQKHDAANLINKRKEILKKVKSLKGEEYGEADIPEGIASADFYLHKIQTNIYDLSSQQAVKTIKASKLDKKMTKFLPERDSLLKELDELEKKLLQTQSKVSGLTPTKGADFPEKISELKLNFQDRKDMLKALKDNGLELSSIRFNEGPAKTEALLTKLGFSNSSASKIATKIHTPITTKKITQAPFKILPQGLGSLKISKFATNRINYVYGSDLNVLRDTAKQSGLSLEDGVSNLLKSIGLSDAEVAGATRQIINKPIRIVAKAAESESLGGQKEVLVSLTKQRNKLLKSKEKLDHRQSKILRDADYRPGAYDSAKKLAEDTLGRVPVKGHDPYTLDEYATNSKLMHGLLYNRTMTDFGINMPHEFGGGFDLLGRSEFYSTVDSAYGTDTFGMLMDFLAGNGKKLKLNHEVKKNLGKSLDVLKASGATGEQIYDWQYHVFRDPKTGKMAWHDVIPMSDKKAGHNFLQEGTKFGEKAANKQFTNIRPTEAQKEQLFKMKDIHDFLYSQQPGKVGKFLNYVPTMSKTQRINLDYSPERRLPLEEVKKAAFHKTRTIDRPLNEEAEFFVMDGYKNFEWSIKRQINEAAYGDAFNKGMDQAIRLNMLGKGKLAGKVVEHMKSVVGRSNWRDTVEYLVQSRDKDFLEPNGWGKYWTDLIANSADKKLSNWAKTGELGKDVLKVVRSGMYGAFIGMNPKLLMMNLAQPLLMGSVEVGFGNMGKAYVEVGSRRNTKFKEIYNSVKDELSPTTETLEIGDVADKHLKLVDNIVNLPSKLGLWGMKLGESFNREVSFNARLHAWEGAKKAKKMNELFEGLLPAQRTYIAEAYEKGGEVEAMKTFGIIGSLRDNYIYSAVDRSPMVQMFSDYVPFLTWGANQWSRFYGDVAHNPKMLAKRLGYAYLGMYGIQLVTGNRLQPQRIKLPIPGVGVEVAYGTPATAMLQVLGSETYGGILSDSKLNQIQPWFKLKKVIDDFKENAKPKFELPKAVKNKWGTKSPALVRFTYTKPKPKVQTISIEKPPKAHGGIIFQVKEKKR